MLIVPLLRLGQAGVFVSTLGLQLACSPAEEGAPRPGPGRSNVLLILVDDLNTHLGTYGHPLVDSPNIDRLARGGVRFDRAYAQYPLCTPSRTSLFSGRYPEDTGVFENDDDPRQNLTEATFLPEAFQQQGYVTAGLGKVIGPYNGIEWGAPPIAPHSDSEVSSPSAGSADQGPSSDQQTLDGRETSLAIRWLESAGDQPFFLVLGLNATHLPFKAPNRDLVKYPPYSIELLQEPPGHLADVPDLALTETPVSLMTRNHQDQVMTDLKRRQVIRSYYACISLIDSQVGRILEALHRLDLRQETIVVLTSDHGFHLGEHGGLWRKMSLFEESLRVPLIVSAPGTARGVGIDKPVELVDLYPTLLELVGIDRPRGLRGLSLVPFLENPSAKRQRPAYSVVRRPANRMGRSVRTLRYRYTEWEDDGQAELYDHRKDPHEYWNVASDAAHARTITTLSRLLRTATHRARKRL